jgi:hypothetical protein
VMDTEMKRRSMLLNIGVPPTPSELLLDANHFSRYSRV